MSEWVSEENVSSVTTAISKKYRIWWVDEMVFMSNKKYEKG